MVLSVSRQQLVIPTVTDDQELHRLRSGTTMVGADEYKLRIFDIHIYC